MSAFNNWTVTRAPQTAGRMDTEQNLELTIEDVMEVANLSEDDNRPYKTSLSGERTQGVYLSTIERILVTVAFPVTRFPVWDELYQSLKDFQPVEVDLTDDPMIARVLLCKMISKGRTRQRVGCSHTRMALELQVVKL